MEVEPKARLREKEEGPGEALQPHILLLEITAEQLEDKKQGPPMLCWSALKVRLLSYTFHNENKCLDLFSPSLTQTEHSIRLLLFHTYSLKTKSGAK